MAYSTRGSSKASSEHGDILSPAEAEMIKQNLESKERQLREQSEAVATRQLEVKRQAAELEKEKERQRRTILNNTQGIENVLASLQKQLQELHALKDMPQQIRTLSDRVNTLQTQTNYSGEMIPPYPNETCTTLPTETPYIEPSPIRLKDVADSIPKYDGQRMSVFQFCKSCERALELIPRHHEQYLIQLILSKLQGHAYTAIEGTEYKSVNQSLRKLKQIFGPNKSLNQYKGELGNAYMKANESIFDYIARIKDLKTAIIDCESVQSSRFDDWAYDNIERDVLESFVNGLHSDLLIRVKIEGYDSLDDAFTKAIQISKTLESEAIRRRAAYFNRPNTPPPRQDTHFLNPRIPSTTPISPTPQPTSILQRPQNAPYIRPLIPGQPGPNAPSQIICRYCKDPGHVIANCQKLASKNAYQKHSNSTNQSYEHTQSQSQGFNNSGNAQRAPVITGARRDTENAGRQQLNVRFQDQTEKPTPESRE